MKPSNDPLQNLTLSKEFILQHQIIPLEIDEKNLHVGIADLSNTNTLDAIKFQTGLNVFPILIHENQITEFIEKNFQQKNLYIPPELSREEHSHFTQENSVNYDEPLIQFTDQLLQHAIQKSASDIHIEPFKTHCRIRYRQDGLLNEISQITSSLANRLIVRLKVMANLDITERRLPQDGHFQRHTIDIRINTCPTVFGEKIVLRLLDTQKNSLAINQLGMSAQQEKLFLKNITQPQGLILVSGPTGSGKSVTLYSALKFLNCIEKNILTIEDPVEIQLDGINQVNTHAKIGLDFSTLLRSFLRQDPDIIMVGEIRDTETAKIAIQAAQTGHLVLSTIHTNNSFNTLIRLKSMGITSYDIASSLSLIITQRLIRKRCKHCLNGCQHCTQGYQGREGIYEFLPISEKISELILENANVNQIKNQAENEGFLSLYEHGLEKIKNNITHINELNRVASP